MNKPWVLKQTWEHLLFLHWEIEPAKIKDLIPEELELDTYNEKSWLTVLPFKVSRQRFRWLPEIPLLTTYLELNVRTYVIYKGIPGVYFFTLDANHPLTVLGAKAISLPYRNAKINLNFANNEMVFNSRRIFEPADFSVAYEPDTPPLPTQPGSIDYWLLERYSLFTKWGNNILRGDISHESWEVSNAKAKIMINTVAPFSLTLQPKLLHYALKKETLILPIKKAGC